MAARRSVLVAILGATFMLLVDVTIVQVALPRIHTDLGGSFTGLEWVIDAYSLSLAALILTSGALADRFGRKRIFIAGVAIFSIASLLCALSTSLLQLDLFRALQGVGGAAMFATSLALIGQEFTGRERGTAIALWGATIGGAVAIGPLLGGLLTEAFGWKWIFLVNVPIGGVVAWLAGRTIANVRDPDAKTADAFGLVTFSASLSLLVFALLRGNDKGWSSAFIVGAFVGAALLLIAFVVIEARQERPMLDLSLFRGAAFCGVTLGTFAIGAGMFAMFPYISYYLQVVLGLSPLQGGLRVLPATLLAFAVPLAARKFAGKISPVIHLWVGLGLVSVGLLLMLGLSAGSGWTHLLPGLLVVGFGIGLANPAIGQLALAVAPPERAGMASGISNTARIGGLATGIAALGALLEDRIGTRLHTLVPDGGTRLTKAVVSGGTHAAAGAAPLGHQSQYMVAARDAWAFGLNADFVAGAVTLGLGTVLVLVLVRVRRPPPEQAPAASSS